MIMIYKSITEVKKQRSVVYWFDYKELFYTKLNEILAFSSEALLQECYSGRNRQWVWSELRSQEIEDANGECVSGNSSFLWL